MTISKMTDDELVRAVAEEVMGWNCVEFEGCDWWDTGDKDDERYWPTLHFVPLLDYNHTFVVVEQMRELGWSFILHGHSDGNNVEFYKWKPKSSYHVLNRPNKRAILEAALEAVREMK